MRQKAKYYPYPILAKNTGSYKSSTFATAITLSQDLHTLTIGLQSELQNSELEELLRQGKVVFACHVECGQTCFRHIYTTSRTKDDFTIDIHRLNGIIEVSSFLMAAEDIPAFSSDDFSEDYAGMSFYIYAGLRLGIGHWMKFRLEKNQDDFSDSHSIFSIVPTKNKNQVYMNLEYEDEDRIKIILPEKTCMEYRSIAHDAQYVELMHSVLLVPALTQLLSELKYDAEAVEAYKDCRWYQSICSVYKKRGKIFEEIVQNCNPIEEAQRLLADPITKGLVKLGQEDECNEN